MQTTSKLLGIAVMIVAVRISAQNAVTSSGGATNSVPVFTGPASIGVSVITQSSQGYIGIGSTAPSSLLFVAGPSAPRITINNTQTGSVDEGIIFSSASEPNASIVASWWGGGMTFTTPRDLIQSGFHFFAQAGTEVAHIDTSSGGMAIGSTYASAAQQAPANGLIVRGSVGIGTTSPGASLEVNGNVRLTSGSGASVTFADGTQQTTAWTGVLCGGDYAEAVNASGGKKAYGPGDVLVLASDTNGNVEKSSESYSTMVAGIFATKPGVIGRRETLAKSADELPMAMVGIVPTKVSAENGAIRQGDLLVSSSKPGYAMKGTDRTRMLGAVIGKAMGSLDSGTGVIEVLVTLQ